MKSLILSLLLILQSIPLTYAQAVPNTYNSSGIPQTKTFKTYNGLLSRIDPAVLHDTRKINPNYLTLDPERTNVTLREAANIRITFLKEGAGYKNWFGYFTYTGNTPPSNPTLVPIFPNVSQGTGLLQYGDTVLLGQFPTGTKIGFAIVADGFNNSNNGGYLTNKPKFYSIRNLNPKAPKTVYGSGDYSNLKIDTKDVRVQRVAYFWDAIDQVGVIGFDDQLSDPADYDFDDVVFTISSDPAAAIIPPDDVPITTVSGVLCHLENNGNYTSISYSGESARDTLFAAHTGEGHNDDIKNMATCPAKKTNICHIPGGQDASAAKIISVGNPALANGHEANAHGGDFVIDLNSQSDIDRCFATLCRESDGTTFKRCCNIKINSTNYSESEETLTSGNDPHYAGQSCDPQPSPVPTVVPAVTPSPEVVIPTPTVTPTPEIVYPAAVCHAEPVTPPENPSYIKTSGDADHAIHILSGQDVLPDEAGNCPIHTQTTYTVCQVLARDPITNAVTNSIEKIISASEYSQHFPSNTSSQYIEKPITGSCPVFTPEEQIKICHYDTPNFVEPVTAPVYKIGTVITGPESILTEEGLAQGDFKINNDLNGNACSNICIAGCDIVNPTPNIQITPNDNNNYSCASLHPNDSCCESVDASGTTTWKQCCESPNGNTLTIGEDPHYAGNLCGSQANTPTAEPTTTPNSPTPGTPNIETQSCATVQPGDACCDSVNDGIVTWKSCCQSPSGETLTTGIDPHDNSKTCDVINPTPEPTGNISECTTVCNPASKSTQKACTKAEVDGLLASGWTVQLSECAGSPPPAPKEGKSYDFLVQITNMLISSAVGYVGSTMICVPPPVSIAYFKVVAIASQIMDLFVAAKGVGATAAALQWVMSSYGVPWITQKIVSVICSTMGLSETLSPLVTSGTAKLVIQTLVSSFITSASNYAMTEGLDVDEWGDIGKGSFLGKTQTAKMEKTDPQITSIKKQIYNTQGQLELNNVQLVVAYTKLGFYSIAIAIELVDAVSALFTGRALTPPTCTSPEAIGCKAEAPKNSEKPQNKKANPPYHISSRVLQNCVIDPKCTVTLPSVSDGKGGFKPATRADYESGATIVEASHPAAELAVKSDSNRASDPSTHNKALALQRVIMESNNIRVTTEGGNPAVPFQGALKRDGLEGKTYITDPNPAPVVKVNLTFSPSKTSPGGVVPIEFAPQDVANSFTTWAHGFPGTYSTEKSSVHKGSYDKKIIDAKNKFNETPGNKEMLMSLGEGLPLEKQEAIARALSDKPGTTYAEEYISRSTPEERQEFLKNYPGSTIAPQVAQSINIKPEINVDIIHDDQLASNYAMTQASRITTQFSNNEIIAYSGRYNFSLARVFGSSELPVWTMSAKAFNAEETERIIQKVVKIKLQLCGSDIDSANCKQTFDNRFIPWIKSQFEGAPISEPIFEAEFTDSNEKLKLKTFLLEAGYISSKTFDQFKHLMNRLLMPEAVADDEQKPTFWSQAGTGATMALGSFVIGKIVQKIVNASFKTSATRAIFYGVVTALQGAIIADLHKKREILNDQLDYQKKLLAYICTNLGGNNACAEVSNRQESSWEKTLDKVKAPVQQAAPAQQNPNVTPTPETTLLKNPMTDDLYSFIEDFKNKFLINKAQASVNSPYQVKSIKVGNQTLPINFDDNFINTANKIDPNMMKTIHSSALSLGKISNNFLTGKAESLENSKEMTDFINSQAKIQDLVKKANNYYNNTAKSKNEKPLNITELSSRGLASLRNFLDSVVTKDQLANFFNIGGLAIAPIQNSNKDQATSEPSSTNQVAGITGVKATSQTTNTMTKPTMRKETKLEDMDVELEDISRNGSGSIFRIISNRYLKVYNN